MTARTRSGVGGRARAIRLLAPAILVAVLVPLMAAGPAAARPGGLSGTMSIDDGAASTAVQSVALASDVPGATQMRFRDAGGSWTDWEPYSGSKAWTLPAGDAVKTVDARYKAGKGRTLRLSDTIVFDTTAPVTGNDYDAVPRPAVTVTFSPVDALSAVATTCWRVNGGAWRAGTSASLSLAARTAVKRPRPHVQTLEYYSVDALGNSEQVQTLLVTLQ